MTRYLVTSALLLSYSICLLLIADYFWIRLKRDGANKAFNFRITDIWAAMAGTAPSFWVVMYFNEDALQRGVQTGDLAVMAFALFLLIGGQILGLVIGRIHIELPPHSGAKNAFQSAVSIIAGALIGLILPAVFVLVVSMSYRLFRLYGVLSLAAAIVVLGFWRLLRRQRMRPSAPGA